MQVGVVGECLRCGHGSAGKEMVRVLKESGIGAMRFRGGGV